MATQIELSYSEIIANQATINIGCIGHVSEGKSTVVRALTGTATQRHKKEQESQCTIKLGYANFKVWYDPNTGDIFHTPSNVKTYQHPDTNNDLVLVKHVSFVDCPGHEAYMATMVGGSSVMDCAFLLIGANNAVVPQRQTDEHMKVLNRTDVSDILVLQNKVDLLQSEEEAYTNLTKLQKYLATTKAKDSTIMPVSAQQGTNIDHVCSYVTNNITQRNRSLNDKLCMQVIRSFDINKPGTRGDSLQGGIVGGSISNGVMRVGDWIEIRPGVGHMESGKQVFRPLITQVTSIGSESNRLDYAIPGGLIGVGTNLDPFLCGANKLVGQVVGHVGKMPSVYEKFKIDIEDFLIDMHIIDFSKGESIVICINNHICKATITPSLKEKMTVIVPVRPICCKVGQKMAIFKEKYGKHNLVCIAKIATGIKAKNFVLPTDYSSYKSDEYEYTIKMDLPDECVFEKETFDYDTLLEKFTFEKHDNKLQVPTPKIQRENRKVYLVNAQDIIKSLHKDKDYDYQELFIGFLRAELVNKICRYTNDRHILIEGIFRSQHIEGIVRRYITTYVLCGTCRSFSTRVMKIGQRVKRSCDDCSAKVDV